LRLFELDQRTRTAAASLLGSPRWSRKAAQASTEYLAEPPRSRLRRRLTLFFASLVGVGGYSEDDPKERPYDKRASDREDGLDRSPQLSGHAQTGKDQPCELCFRL